MLAIIISFIVCGIGFAGLLYTLLNRKYRKYYVSIKMFNSALFLINLSVMTVISGNRMPFAYLMPGFFLCFVGDLALGLHNKYVNKKYLITGTGLFLLGHICFLTYFYSRVPFMIYDVIMPVIGVIAVIILKHSKSFSLGSFAYPGMVYAIFVAGMAGKSFELLILNPCANTICLALGGLFFLTSDVLIAPLYFKTKRAWAIHGFNIGTYYLAMFCIAISVLF